MKINVFKSIHTAVIAAVICALPAFQMKGEEKSTLSSKDKAFIEEAGEGGHMEVEMGKIGLEKSGNAAVKSLAEMLVTDHSKANEKLAKLAASKGVEPPKSPSLKQKASLKMLQMKSGESFDKAFAEDAVEDHKKDIAAFEKAAKELDDADLKAFAAKTVPTLKMHLSMAEKALAAAK